MSNKQNMSDSTRPRHLGGVCGGRAPAKIVRAPEEVTGLFMFKKIEKDQMATLWVCSMEAGADGWVTLTLIPAVTRLTA